MSRNEPILRSAGRIASSGALSLLLVGPAHATSAVVLPDPSDATLFTLGIAGLLIGRHVANKRRD